MINHKWNGSFEPVQVKVVRLVDSCLTKRVTQETDGVAVRVRFHDEGLPWRAR